MASHASRNINAPKAPRFRLKRGLVELLADQPFFQTVARIEQDTVLD